ncbi:hypothetical protein [Aeromonas veronii]|uniref:phage tail fiber protein n=1 Tax=Aeromonas veronii TaxID=654 RepID=UPI003D1F2975
MGFWLSDGTVSLVSNSKTVTGTGTAFKSGANPARVGQSLIVYVGGNTAIYEIERVDSDSSMQIAIPWRGATINNAPYAINTASEGSPSDLSRRAAQVMGYYQGQLDVIQALLVGTGDVSATLPDGTVVVLPSFTSISKNKQDASKILSSISGLNTTKDTILFFSDKDSASTTALTELSRRIMASQAAADIRTLLQLGTASVKNTGSSYGDVMSVGDFGLGSESVKTGSVIDQVNNPTGFYHTADILSSLGPYMSVVHVGYRGSGYAAQIGMQQGGSRVKVVARSVGSQAGVWLPTVELRHTGNTTVDSNGFIKNASPIMRLHGSDDDTIAYLYRDEDWVRSGVGLVNSEAAGAVAERISTGHYRITGCYGFSREGWYIETPGDANGNKILFVKYLQNENGSIDIWTSLPDYSTGRCTEGEPLDIPHGRWIDLRLCMDDRDISLAS